jgi:ubiquitin-like modifier-activating enzyme ATG7
MPGHFTVSEEHTKKVFENLDFIESLVESHDVIYLLTDNRESRWLPTVLANKYNKLCITVALGFDSYMV